MSGDEDHSVPSRKDSVKMADRRLVCFVEAHNRGLTIIFDPSGDRNRCFYECLAKHLKVFDTDDVIDKVFSFMAENQFVSMKNEDGKVIERDLFDYFCNADFPNLKKRPTSWDAAVTALFDQMAPHLVIRCAATLFSLDITTIDWRGRCTVVKPFMHNASDSVSLSYTGSHYMLLGSQKRLASYGKHEVTSIETESGNKNLQIGTCNGDDACGGSEDTAIKSERRTNCDDNQLATNVKQPVQEEETIASVTQSVNNAREPVENGEGPARIEELTGQLRDAMSEIENLKKINRTLANHNKNLIKRINDSAVRSEVIGVPLDDVSDNTTREFNTSGPAKARLLESQFDILSIENLPDFVDDYYKMEKKLDSTKNACEKQKQVFERKQAELIKTNAVLQAENNNLIVEIMELRTENISLSSEKLKRKLEGGNVHVNDNEDGNKSEEDGKNSNEEEPPELAGFFNAFVCPVSCGTNVVFFILYIMGLRLCFRRWVIYFRRKIPGAKIEVEKCSSSLTDFSKAGLLEDKDVFNETITDEYTIDDALRDLRKELKDQTDPAVLAIEYKKNPDGTQPVGHCVAIMCDGKYIDVKERRYWTPTPVNRISHIHVVKINKSVIAEWQRKCGMQNCENECTVCCVESSIYSLE